MIKTLDNQATFSILGKQVDNKKIEENDFQSIFNCYGCRSKGKKFNSVRDHGL